MLKPEDAEKVLTKNLANVIRKANTGKPLTAAERALIEQAAAGGTLTDTGSAFAKTYDELAQRFGLTRKTLQNARKRFPDDSPKERADGRHDVAAWSQFLVKHNIARTAENIAGAPAAESEISGPITVTDWKAREIELKCAKLEIENAKTAGELIDAAEVESGTSHLVSGFRQALNNFVPRLAAKIVGVKDYHEAEELIQAEVNVVLRTLQRCDFLESPVTPVNEVTQVKTPVIETVSKPCSSGKRKAVVTTTPRPLKKTTSPGSGKRKTSRSRASRSSREVKRK